MEGFLNYFARYFHYLEFDLIVPLENDVISLKLALNLSKKLKKEIVFVPEYCTRKGILIPVGYLDQKKFQEIKDYIKLIKPKNVIIGTFLTSIENRNKNIRIKALIDEKTFRSFFPEKTTAC